MKKINNKNVCFFFIYMKTASHRSHTITGVIERFTYTTITRINEERKKYIIITTENCKKGVLYTPAEKKKVKGKCFSVFTLIFIFGGMENHPKTQYNFGIAINAPVQCRRVAEREKKRHTSIEILSVKYVTCALFNRV